MSKYTTNVEVDAGDVAQLSLFDADRTFLAAIINDQAPWLPTRLQSCLGSIETGNPLLAENLHFQRLLAYVHHNQP